MDFLRLPFFEAVRDAETVLLAGAGGGYDIYTGLPLYLGLRAAGKTVHLANLSFTHLYATDGKRIGEALVEVTHQTEESTRYFPELHLCRWFKEKRGEDVPVYCFDRTGPAPITRAYRNLLAHLGGSVDAVILIDGGTDSLMRGDEAGLGTPEEDVASICAVNVLEGVDNKLLVCVGFGIDTYHGVCHAHFLEAVADLTREGAFLGAWSLLPNMPEAAQYREAVEWVHRAMFNQPSIVSSSILSAVEGQFGDHHTNFRTSGSKLFINPLMGLYWAFRLGPVARRNLYLEQVRDLERFAEVSLAIARFRAGIQDRIKSWQDLPM
jgi:hypothetical protein